MNLSVKDSSPFDVATLTPSDEVWLSRLAKASRHGDLVVRLESGREDEPLVWCERDGSWWAGRYVGTVTFEGRSLDIHPRFGEQTLLSWLVGAFNFAMVDTDGQPAESDWFVPWLLASVWSRAFVSAARHGVPALKTDVRESGLSVKGRIDVPGTVRLRWSGTPGAASVRHEKSLANPISAAIVAAHAELTRWIGRRRLDECLPERVKEILPHLVAVVGSRPKVPTLAQLNRVRLTPITAGFGPLAELSVQIANRRGLIANASDEGACKGVLLDVAELWELYVLAVLRRAWPAADVEHGTRESAESLALLSNDKGKFLGRLKPDAVIRLEGVTAAVIDAKYKRLHPSIYNQAPQREDLYQLVAYLGRYRDSTSILGALVYPMDDSVSSIPPAEAGNPWRIDGEKEVRFMALPHNIDEAVQKIRSVVPISSGLAHIAV